MLKKIVVWSVVAVALVLAVQVLVREGPPPSLFVPPSMKLPAVAEIKQREAERGASVSREDVEADGPASSRAAQTADSRRRGVTFQARGNEPSWLLDISYERIGIALELGARRIEFPHRTPTISGTRATYRTFSGTQELNVIIDGVPCNDTMSGERFAATVTVTFENRTLYGCGGPP